MSSTIASLSRGQDEIIALHLFYNLPTSGPVYEPVGQRLLPLDEAWRRRLAELPWPTRNCSMSSQDSRP